MLCSLPFEFGLQNYILEKKRSIANHFLFISKPLKFHMTIEPTQSWLSSKCFIKFLKKLTPYQKITFQYIRTHFTTCLHIFQYFSVLFIVNPFQPSAAFHIETSHLFCYTKHITSFYMKQNTGLKWVKHCRILENIQVNTINSTK